MPAAGTVVEVVLLSATVAGALRYRMRTRTLAGRRHPDDVARDLAGLAGDPTGLLHSTSWRFHRNRVVLTYAALPDPDPDQAGAAPVRAEGATTSGDPLAPTPARITADDVAVHACRHLAYLRHTDPVVAGRAAAAPDLWSCLERFTPTVAGLLVQPEPTLVR
jgi:hypothetical protein